MISERYRFGTLFEEHAGFEHGVHYDGQLARNGNRRAFEAYLFKEFEAPHPQVAIG